MPRYRKLPVVIDAEIYRPGLEDEYAMDSNGKIKPCINTPKGKHFINPGDYIITGIAGERYPCKADIFEKTYEKEKE